MKKYFFLLLLTACSTYVPVEYLTPSEYSAKKDSYVQINTSKEYLSTPAEKLFLIEELGRELNNDGWLRYKREKGPKPLYEITINQFAVSSQAIPASTETVDKKTYRTSSYRSIGSASFSIKKIDEESSTPFNVSTNTIVASRIELPDIFGTYSRVSLFSTLLGSNSEADAIYQQDNALSLAAVAEAKKRLFDNIKSKITPVKNLVKIKLEDDSDDMKEVKDLLKDQDLTGAIIYLDYLNAKERRNDVLYNLGVVYEALGYYSEACNYYKEAYDLSAKSSYLDEKIACEKRLQYYNQLPF